jgi:hypothetical protein
LKMLWGIDLLASPDCGSNFWYFWKYGRF